MKISVTQEHIDNGSRGCSPLSCMVALALQSAGFPNSAAGVHTVTLDYKSGNNIILPAPVAQSIHAFMRHEKVEPFEFELEVPA